MTSKQSYEYINIDHIIKFKPLNNYNTAKAVIKLIDGSDIRTEATHEEIVDMIKLATE